MPKENNWTKLFFLFVIDLISIKELLGHSRLETTLVYLHVADQPKHKKISPLDTLLGKHKESEKVKLNEKFYELTIKRNLTEKASGGQLNLFEGENKHATDA